MMREITGGYKVEAFAEEQTTSSLFKDAETTVIEDETTYSTPLFNSKIITAESLEQNDEPTSETVDISTQDDITLTVQDRESIEEEDSSEEDFTEEASIPFGLDIPKKDKFRVNNDTTTGSPATPIVEAVVAEIESQEEELEKTTTEETIFDETTTVSNRNEANKIGILAVESETESDNIFDETTTSEPLFQPAAEPVITEDDGGNHNVEKKILYRG